MATTCCRSVGAAGLRAGLDRCSTARSHVRPWRSGSGRGAGAVLQARGGCGGRDTCCTRDLAGATGLSEGRSFRRHQLGKISVNVRDDVCVVTGGASGIGRGLCTRFAHEGAHVVLSDLNQDACEEHAAPIGAFPAAADVGREEQIEHLVAATVEKFRRIDLFVSHAGIAIDGGIDTLTDKWQKIIAVNRRCRRSSRRSMRVPQMLEQGSGMTHKPTLSCRRRTARAGAADRLTAGASRTQTRAVLGSRHAPLSDPEERPRWQRRP